MFVVRVDATVIAPGGFAGHAEFGQMFEGRGHALVKAWRLVRKF